MSVTRVSTRSELKKFVRLPWSIYRGETNWVPPLIYQQMKFFDLDSNPFFEHAETALFLAEREGDLAGRIAACIDQNYISFHGEKTGFFGFFECENDLAVAAELLQEASDFLRSRGMEKMLGPMSFTTNHQCGLLVEGFERPPSIMMNYNPAYYVELFEEWGLRKAKDLLAYWRGTERLPEKFVRAVRLAEQKERISIRKINMKKFSQELEIIRQIYNDAWSENWGFVPLAEREFLHIAREMRPILDPDLLLIAEVEGEPAGFSLALPDINPILRDINGRLLPLGFFELLIRKRRTKVARLITMGVKKNFRNKGIDALFYLRSIEVGRTKGYEGAELSWVLEDNIQMNRIIQRIGGKLIKRYRVYEKELGT